MIRWGWGWFWGIMLGLGLLACSDSVAGRGGADETSNGIHAVVLDSLGLPVRSALVLVRPADFVAHHTMSSTHPGKGVHNLMTDSAGRFVLDTLAQGQYILEVRTDTSGLSVPFEYAVSSKGSVLPSDTLSLLRLGELKGYIQLPPGVAFARVYVLGLEHWVVTDSLGYFELPLVPAGQHTLVALMPQEPTVLGQLQVELSGGDSIFADTLPVLESAQIPWKHGASVVVNTLLLGADFSENLHHYPLMVRLIGESFPEEASAQGADLRVVDSLGNPIPFAISHWDALSQEATLWILLDTLKSQDSSVVAYLRWGRSGLLPADRPDQVFDTLQNWALMLPLQSAFRDSANVLRTPDLSGYARHGLAIGTNGAMPDFSRQGAGFDGVEQAVGIGRFPLNFGDENFTVEAWIYPQATAGIWLSRDNKGEGNWNHSERAFYLGKPGSSVNVLEGLNPILITHGSPNNTYCPADQEVALNQWVHLALQRTEYSGDTALVQWFINGVAVPMLYSKVVDRSDNLNDTLYIAGKMFERSFYGKMVHLQIARTARSPAWIYINSILQRDEPNQVLQIQDQY